MLKLAFLTTDNREHDNNYSAPVPYFGTAPTALLEGFANLPDLEVHILSCTQQPMSSPAKLANNIWFHSLHVPKIGWLRTCYSGCILAFRKKLKEIQPDIVHGQGTERDCGISAVFSGYPNVITIHGNMAQLARTFHSRLSSFYWWAAKLENFTLPRSSGIFCNSIHTENLVLSRTKKTWLVPNALRAAFFSDKLTPQKVSEKPRLLVVGVVTPNKRQLEILSCLKSLRRQGASFDAVFIGSCGSGAYCRDFLIKLAEAENDGWATFSGYLDEATIVQSMNNAHALIHFPLEEAFGLVVAESLARGLKVFASNVGGIRDIASGVPEAELFAPDDWDGLSRALVAWLQKPSLSSVETQNLMRSRYHPKTIATRHLEIYREVTTSR
jgi:glycosyltransferase involved in cell wall biosynthesis